MLVCAGALTFPGAALGSDPADPVLRTVPRRQGEEEAHTHRIPGLAATGRSPREYRRGDETLTFAHFPRARLK